MIMYLFRYVTCFWFSIPWQLLVLRIDLLNYFQKYQLFNQGSIILQKIDFAYFRFWNRSLESFHLAVFQPLPWVFRRRPSCNRSKPKRPPQNNNNNISNNNNNNKKFNQLMQRKTVLCRYATKQSLTVGTAEWDLRYCYNLIYKGESMCVCVCPAACRRTHTSHQPKIWRGLLISPWLGTEPGGDPKCWPPGVPPVVTLSEKPWRVRNWAGASKQKLLPGVGWYIKILFVGSSPQPQARRVLRSICPGLFHNEIVK